ncbi:hypothetical protein DYQ86_10130 [Acidobacteria bacterium AB60]|nr:hypothetical protein DYQ86_10130 [Acidobacteria bacterium AB60]
MKIRLRKYVRLVAILLVYAIFLLASSRTQAQSLAPTLAITADSQSKIYGTSDPVFTYSFQGFTNGDTATVVSGQPAITAPQRVQNLWQFTESLPAWLYTTWQFSTDGSTQQANGIQLSHVASAGNFYSSISSPMSAFAAPVVVPGMPYLLSFDASSTLNSYQVYWHRYLSDGNAYGWGQAAIGPALRRVVFQCAGTASGALDCGGDPTVPIGSGPDQTVVYWLFLGKNNALSSDPSAAGFQQSVAADLYVGGFQMEPAVSEKRGIVAMGDSLTQYDCSTADLLNCSSWTAVAASQLNVPFYNRGSWGQTCAQIQARWAADASPILAANAKYAIIFCGTNDLGLGYSSAQIEQSIAAMASLAAADGATPVLVTIGPFVTTVPNAESSRQAVNAWIRATYPLVLDFDHVNADPANPAQQNPAYVGDGVHLNFAGRVAEGNYVAQAIAGNTKGYPGIWSFQQPVPYEAVLGANPSNGMDFHPGAQREVGTYIILPAAGTLASSKYRFAFNTARLNVFAAPLTVSANNKTMTYGAALPALDGSISGALPSDSISATYSTNATISSPPGTYTITATLVDPGHRLSNYTVTQNSGTLTVVPAVSAAPTFTVAPGVYVSTPMVAILDSTPGAVIRYTTDGSTPNGSSTIYTGPFSVASSETIQAYATAPPGYTASSVASASYIIVPLITGLSPAYTAAGNSAITLTVSGSGFNPGSTVRWGQTALATQFVSPASLSAKVPGSVVANAGLSAITVQDGVSKSNAFQFEIDSGSGSTYAPAFTPSTMTVTPGAAATYRVTLPSTATGASANCLNLPANATCAYSYATGTLTIATSPSTVAGSYSIVVVFTETVPASTSAWIVIPLLLVPVSRSRKRCRMRSPAIVIAAALLAGLGALSACGGNTPATPPRPGQQVTASAVVVLNVQ